MCPRSAGAGHRPAGQHAVVGLRVVAHQRGVHDRDPPHRVTDGPARPGRSQARILESRPAASHIAVRASRARSPRPCVRPDRGRARPSGTAPSRSPVLAARREHRSALFAAPGVGHPVVSPPSVECAPYAARRRTRRSQRRLACWPDLAPRRGYPSGPAGNTPRGPGCAAGPAGPGHPHSQARSVRPWLTLTDAAPCPAAGHKCTVARSVTSDTEPVSGPGTAWSHRGGGRRSRSGPAAPAVRLCGPAPASPPGRRHCAAFAPGCLDRAAGGGLARHGQGRARRGAAMRLVVRFLLVEFSLAWGLVLAAWSGSRCRSRRFSAAL